MRLTSVQRAQVSSIGPERDLKNRPPNLSTSSLISWPSMNHAHDEPRYIAHYGVATSRRRRHVSPQWAIYGDNSNNAHEGAAAVTSNGVNEPRRHVFTALSPARMTFAALWVLSGWGCYSVLSGLEHDLPRIPPWTLPSLSALLVLGLMSVAVAKATFMRDTLHFEWHRGRLYIQAGVPSSGPGLIAGSVQVLPTNDGRGNGAYAGRLIPKGTHICDYEGELLNREQYARRYPDGVGDYALVLDEEFALDAAGLVDQTQRFSAVHMNHSSVRSNVLRYYERAAQRVAFFASRDIKEGEELLFDYGRAYWRGREALEMP